MIQATVIGNVIVENTPTWLDDPSYLLVQPVDDKDAQNSLIALDLIGAKNGERVLISQGSSCRQTDFTRDKPVDAIICGIIDIVVRDNKEIYNKYEG